MYVSPPRLRDKVGELREFPAVYAHMYLVGFRAEVELTVRYWGTSGAEYVFWGDI